jgi:galactarate dehydratase
MSEMTSAAQPRLVRMHPADNVAIVVNEGGLPAGTLLEGGLVLLDKVPQGHKVTLVALAQGEAVRRYNVPIGYVLQDIAAGLWVHERLLQMPAARELQGLPMATVAAPVQAPLTG